MSLGHRAPPTSIRLPERVRIALRRQAKKEHRPVATLIIHILLEWLERKGEKLEVE
jgi:hypothetical protein